LASICVTIISAVMLTSYLNIFKSPVPLNTMAFILAFFLSLFYFGFNTLLMIVFRMIGRDLPSPDFKKYWKYYVICGILLGFFNILSFYALINTRTPHMVVEIVILVSFLAGFPASAFIHQKSFKRKTLCNWRPLIAINIVLWGMGCCLIPIIYYHTLHPIPVLPSSAIWCILFLVAMILNTLYNLTQEKFNRLRAKVAGRSLSVDMTVFNFYSSLFNLIVCLLLFWVDFIPEIGQPLPFALFVENCLKITKQLFSTNSTNNLVYFLVYLISFVLYRVFCFRFNEQSGNYVNMVTALAVPISEIIWYYVPVLSPNGEQKSFWYCFIIAVIIMCIGLCLWWAWETKSKKLKILRSEKVLNFEYFEENNTV